MDASFAALTNDSLAPALAKGSIADRACRLYSSGFEKGAIDLLEVGLTQQPDNGRLWELRSILLAEQGRFQEALCDAGRAQTLVPLTDNGNLALAIALLKTGRLAAAGSHFAALVSASDLPQSNRTTVLQGLLATRQWELAAQQGRQLLHDFPDDERAHFSLAIALRKSGRPVELVAQLIERAIDLAPDQLTYRVALIALWTSSNAVPRAIECLRAIDTAQLETLDCRRCAATLFWLSCRSGDTERAAILGARLASLPPDDCCSGRECRP